MANRKQAPAVAAPQTAAGLQQLLQTLHLQRKQQKQKSNKRLALDSAQRKMVLEKTGSLCHVCGRPLADNRFEADHVQPHVQGGACTPENFLPACKTCNNYRWHYLPQEIQYILKLGVWARSEIEKQTPLGYAMAERFVRKEATRSIRKKSGCHTSTP